MLEKLRRTAESHYLTLASGIALVVSASFEIIKSFESGEIGTEHGVAFFGFVQILKALPDLFSGFEDIAEGTEN